MYIPAVDPAVNPSIGAALLSATPGTWGSAERALSPAEAVKAWAQRAISDALPALSGMAETEETTEEALDMSLESFCAAALELCANPALLSCGAAQVREHSSSVELCGSHITISPAMLRSSNGASARRSLRRRATRRPRRCCASGAFAAGRASRYIELLKRSCSLFKRFCSLFKCSCSLLKCAC